MLWHGGHHEPAMELLTFIHDELFETSKDLSVSESTAAAAVSCSRMLTTT
jgi:hypothetical protein